MTGSEPHDGSSAVDNSTAAPDFYADGVAIELSAFTATLTMTVTSHGVAAPVANIRMSHAHAKAMVMLLRKFMKEVERDLGEPIAVPGAALTAIRTIYEDEAV
jgi:hypothetical protein